MNVNCSSGEMAVTVGNIRNFCTFGTKERRKERMRSRMKQRKKKRREGKQYWM
jgi:hypothetical protein